MHENKLLGIPDAVAVFTESNKHVWADGSDSLSHEDIKISFCGEGDLNVSVTAETSEIEYIRLRWNISVPADAMFMGDAWERTYGDIQWRHMDSARLMPWYFLMNSAGCTSCFGVKVRPGAFALWSADPAGVMLWLDMRCGTKGVRLGGRTLGLVTVVSFADDTQNAFTVLGDFCGKMCDDPILPDVPVYGSNNWYYAYGKSSTEEILGDSRYLAGLAEGLENRPFMVIDDGWQVDRRGGFNGGPWTGGNEKYPDMAALADEMKKTGVRPGIWFRPLWNDDSKIPESWKETRDGKYLDPSIPEVREYVADDIRRISSWGYELIKHDFTTFDMFGLWAFEMHPWPGQGDWAFHDRTKTSAEIVIALYEAILGAAGSTLILGCNTIGHLGAGLMHLARIGDDTSGRSWERTRKMGINTLAFRLPQHNRFFAVDADCVGVTENIEWKYNRQWSELLAYSSTPFFASIKPDVLTPDEFREMQKYFDLASKQKTVLEPVDWMLDTAPRHWLVDGREVMYDWDEKDGAIPDFAVR